MNVLLNKLLCKKQFCKKMNQLKETLFQEGKINGQSDLFT